MLEGILSAVGKTPLVRLTKIEREMKLSAKIYAKPEFFNPAGSVKDRAALFMIRDGENRGALRPGDRIIEATSGNMGIALAMLGARLGYRASIFMPENASTERMAIMRALGAEIHLTNAAGGMSLAVREAQTFADRVGGAVLSQFDNRANKAAHYLTTAPEICEDLGDTPDVFVAGVGTGGTLSGVGEYLRQRNPTVQIYAVEPAQSPVLSEHLAKSKPGISSCVPMNFPFNSGIKADGMQSIPGLGAGFVPTLLNTAIIDGVITVTAPQAYFFARQLALLEGIMAGISSGAALCGAIALAMREENRGKSILTVLPDGAERYFSQEIYILEK